MSNLFSSRNGSPRKRARRPHRLSPVVYAAVLVLGASSLAACGGGSGAASSSDTSTSTAPATTATTPAGASGPNGAAFTKYAACLKKNGVDLPAGGPGSASGAAGSGGPPSTDGGGNGGPPPQNAKFRKAQAACASLRPAGANGGFPGQGNGAATAAFRNCLKINGVTAATARTSAKFKKATAACASLLPQRQAPPTTTGSS